MEFLKNISHFSKRARTIICNNLIIICIYSVTIGRMKFKRDICSSEKSLASLQLIISKLICILPLSVPMPSLEPFQCVIIELLRIQGLLWCFTMYDLMSVSSVLVVCLITVHSWIINRYVNQRWFWKPWRRLYQTF